MVKQVGKELWLVRKALSEVADKSFTDLVPGE
jgi:hypothetical protein